MVHYGDRKETGVSVFEFYTAEFYTVDKFVPLLWKENNGGEGGYRGEIILVHLM